MGSVCELGAIIVPTRFFSVGMRLHQLPLLSRQTGVPLGTSADAQVLLLNATDADGGAAPVFSLCGHLPADPQSFRVGSTTGRLLTTVAVTSSSPAASALCVEAKDDEGLQTRRALLLEVTAANRHAPRFVGGASQRHNVAEDTAVGETVLTFRCSDEDPAVKDRKIRYELTPGYTVARQHFSVVRQTGQLVLIAALDREKLASLRLAVTCTDTGRPARQATAQLEV